MTFSGVIGRTWELYSRFFVRFFVLAVVVFGAVNAVYAVADALLDSGETGQATVIGLAGIAASVVGTFWLQGAMVFAVQDVQDGTFDASTGEVFRRVQPHVGTLILAGLLAGLAISVGFVLLVVPGLFLLTILSLVAPAIVVEGCGVGASFSRSRELVRGHGWTVFGVVLVAMLLTVVTSGVLRAVFSFLPRFLEILIGSTVASSVVAPFGAIAMTVMYFELRGRNGHPSPPPE